MRKSLVIIHLAFEDPGSLVTELEQAGFALETVDACTMSLDAFDPMAPDLVVVLGGPVGVYEHDAYPFLAAEIDLLRARLAKHKPTLGICLGAQLMAAALGAHVVPGSRGKEIGWAPIQPGADAELYPAFASLLNSKLHVLHWHGDTFSLPDQAHHLAATEIYPNQAFAIGRHALGLQFHIEVTAQGLERWYVGHACELGQSRISVPRLREESRLFAPALEAAARRFWRTWLKTAFA